MPKMGSLKGCRAWRGARYVKKQTARNARRNSREAIRTRDNNNGDAEVLARAWAGWCS